MAAAMVLPNVGADVVCQDLIPSLLPCLTYLTAPGPAQLGPGCCSATLSIAEIALQSQADLQGVCTCFKSVADSGAFHINFGNAKAITKLCNLPVNIPIDPSVDCRTITLPKTPPSSVSFPAPALAPSPVPSQVFDELSPVPSQVFDELFR
ncbi:non-specific lipid-transfer protein-like [Impatiens glandulifera]|uniref:non-specific lipid-transfer protein-like n=1 Tax=Impatiens glandulifera TaxID=253017 RepID=UPI001FB0D500|nr:non-specific lipid-transfer protein-like [Impatiens glandulifera]